MNQAHKLVVTEEVPVKCPQHLPAPNIAKQSGDLTQVICGVKSFRNIAFVYREGTGPFPRSLSCRIAMFPQKLRLDKSDTLKTALGGENEMRCLQSASSPLDITTSYAMVLQKIVLSGNKCIFLLSCGELDEKIDTTQILLQ